MEEAAQTLRATRWQTFRTVSLPLMRPGLANAFLHPDVVNAIRLVGPRGIAVSVTHWAGQNRQSTVVGWHLLHDGQDAAVLAARIAAVPRIIEGLIPKALTTDLYAPICAFQLM